MPEPLRRIALLTHQVPEATEKALAQLAGRREQLGIELLVPREEQAKHPSWHDLGFGELPDDALDQVDLCLVLGGDGTILRALSRLVGSGVPTLGVNFGTIGFLASLAPDGWGEELAAVLAGRHQVIDLMTVEVDFRGRRHVGVNDVVLSRVEPRRVLHIAYSISGTPVGEMSCDGMIVASPSGSTAYNLSCDGPLVVWDARVLILNFIAPHSLGFRPVVLRPDHVVTARNTSYSDEADILVDGEVIGRLCCDEEINVTAGRKVARLLVSESGSFYQNVEEKLFNRTGDAR
jgi:NAD+ kinase